MTGYTILEHHWAMPPAPQALKPGEVFTRLMAINGYVYSFEQRKADQRWQLVMRRADPECPEESNDLPFAAETFVSKAVDLEAARDEIVLELISRADWPHHTIFTDAAYLEWRRKPAAA